MSITITINAENGTDARIQLEHLLGLDIHRVPVGVGGSNAVPSELVREQDDTPQGVVADGYSVSKVEPEAPKRTRRTKPAPEAEDQGAASPQPSAPAEDADASADPSAAGSSGSATNASEPEVIAYDSHIRPAILAVSEAGGRDAVTEVLSQFGVNHANKVPQEDWPALLYAAQAKVAEIQGA